VSKSICVGSIKMYVKPRHEQRDEGNSSPVDEGISRVDPPRERGFLKSEHTWRVALATGDFAEIELRVALSSHQSKLQGESFPVRVICRVAR